MNNKNVEVKKPGQNVVKAMAAIARSIAEDSAEARCFMIFHQPEEPKNLATRLEKMQ